jgi:hypothetical protein
LIRLDVRATLGEAPGKPAGALRKESYVPQSTMFFIARGGESGFSWGGSVDRTWSGITSVPSSRLREKRRGYSLSAVFLSTSGLPEFGTDFFNAMLSRGS